MRSPTTTKKFGTVAGGGYIWHTTGSGKNADFLQNSAAASKLDYIDKVLFVVDRKDLDYQTMKEYDRFEKGAANSNTSTAILKRQLEDDNAKIIITTIQKLATFIKKNAGHAVFDKHIVIIFDECHRSQFGDMHLAITKYFRNYHLFGFTGTPIFAVNAGIGKKPTLRTTEQALVTSCIPTPLLTPSMTEMCFHFEWTTSKPWIWSRILTTKRFGTSTGSGRF